MAHLNRRLISLPQGKTKKTIAKIGAEMYGVGHTTEDLRLATALAPLRYRGRQYRRPRSSHRRLHPVKRGLNLGSSTKSDSPWGTTEFPCT